MHHSVSDEDRILLFEGETYQPNSAAAFAELGLGYDIFHYLSLASLQGYA